MIANIVKACKRKSKQKQNKLAPHIHALTKDLSPSNTLANISQLDSDSNERSA